jgi:hypothetical protein
VTHSSASLGRLYLVAAIFALFAIAYGALDLRPSPEMRLCLSFGPALAVAMWLAADSQRTRVAAVQDAGWFFYMGWPLVIPWYALRTRGRAGWSLAFQLYAIALAFPIGVVWGELLRVLARWWAGNAV